MTVVQQQEPSDIRMRRKSKEITKEEKFFACDKKTKRKNRSRTLIDAMKKNEHLSDQWLHRVLLSD